MSACLRGVAARSHRVVSDSAPPTGRTTPDVADREMTQAPAPARNPERSGSLMG
jgi:hypothetical protein